MNIAFIGFGKIAQAIASNLCAQGGHSLSAAAPSLTAGLNEQGVRTYNNNQEAAEEADVIILAVKPSVMSTVLEELKPSSHSVLISVAAGLSLAWFDHYLGSKQALIRAMPNTAAAVGLSATPMFANSKASIEQKYWAEQIFSSMGITTWVDLEEEIDSFTALSGSGPAYVFAFLNAMIDAGIALGIEPSLARTFTLQTCEGALQLAKSSSLDLTQLKDKVISPAGTTAAALAILDKPLQELLLKAMQAAKNRAQELGQLHLQR